MSYGKPRRRGPAACLWLTTILLPCFSMGVAAWESGAEVSPAAIKAAARVQEQVSESLFSAPGVQLVGVGLMDDKKTVGIHVFALPGTLPPSKFGAKTWPTAVQGVPIKVIESSRITAYAYLRAFAGPAWSMPNAKGESFPCDPLNGIACQDDTFPIPVPMGAQVSNINHDAQGRVNVGTMGFRVSRLGNPAEVGYITANHVASPSGPDLCPTQLTPANTSANVPDFNLVQCHPIADIGGNCTSSQTGNLVQPIPLVMGGSFDDASLTFGGFINTMDAAFVRSSRACVSRLINGIGVPSSTVAYPKLNALVRMSGRTSGVRKNFIGLVNAEGLISYGDSCGVAHFKGLALMLPASLESPWAALPGDSGAPVVNRRQRAREARGA